MGTLSNEINNSIQIKWWLLRRGKTRQPGEKPLGGEQRNNKLNPHMTQSLGIESGSRWWEPSALTVTPPLLPPKWLGFNFQALYWLDDEDNSDNNDR